MAKVIMVQGTMSEFREELPGSRAVPDLSAGRLPGRAV